MKLDIIIETFKSYLDTGLVICLRDEQDHKAVVFESLTVRGIYALQHEEGICPIVYPEPEYKSHGAATRTLAIEWLNK